MKTVYLMVGSNSADAARKVAQAVEALRGEIDVFVSEPIVSPDYTGAGPDYLNVVVKAATDLTEARLKELALTIENDLGRDRVLEKSSPGQIIIDVDVVVYDGKILKFNEFDSEPFKRVFNNKI